MAKDTKDQTNEFGTVVRLKSGGPAMTVLRSKEGRKRCVWISSDGEVHYAWFPNPALMMAAADEGARPAPHAVTSSS